MQGLHLLCLNLFRYASIIAYQLHQLSMMNDCIGGHSCKCIVGYLAVGSVDGVENGCTAHGVLF